MIASSPSLQRPWRKLLVTVALACLAFSTTPVAASVSLSSDSALSTAGYFRLSWKTQAAPSDEDSGEKIQFELQQATRADFGDAVTLYHGPDQASVISGLANNTYYYRVRGNGDDRWSNAVSVEVQHHSLAQAFAYFALGIVMFIITVAVLLKGTRREYNHDNA